MLCMWWMYVIHADSNCGNNWRRQNEHQQNNPPAAFPCHMLPGLMATCWHQSQRASGPMLGVHKQPVIPYTGSFLYRVFHANRTLTYTSALYGLCTLCIDNVWCKWAQFINFWLWLLLRKAANTPNKRFFVFSVGTVNENINQSNEKMLKLGYYARCRAMLTSVILWHGA